MFIRRRHAGAAAPAAAVSLALLAGLTGAAPAGAASIGAAPPPGASAAEPAPVGGMHWVTLITGDRVRVDAKGRAAGFEPARGRAGIPVRTHVRDGHTHVVPLDARRLIAEGRLDRRLFDVTELSRAESRRAYADGLRLIVAYAGSAGTSARQAVRAADGTELNRSLRTLGADAVTAAPGLWETLTRETDSGARATASGISRIWLDGIRRATLEKSTAQIGAPAAWRAGYDGKGVKVAVIDSGVDSGHPDLRDRVVAAKNFTAEPDAGDRHGHGTHVAATVAGTGAASAGRYQGIAPGAEIINGKVFDATGETGDSVIAAGIDWAVEQGADIVNLSLGRPDTPETDPLEAQINRITADKGVLFAVAAGNYGPGTLDSPGTADAALTVGAVDAREAIADFSGTGPRIGGGIKPDVTAPGVDITAAAASGTAAGDYAAMSGTSMATPHAAGAAALLKQKNPGWKAKELKGVLTGSAKDGGHSPHQQGTGRIAVDKAIDQSVFAEETSLDFGKQLWPHTDDEPVKRKVTYRNAGTEAVTLDLTATATGPGGKPAPAGFLTTGTDRVTVPAGGTASVEVTTDTRIGGTDDGLYTGAVIASGAGTSVRTAAVVDREVESYNLTLRHIGRDGAPGGQFQTMLVGLTDFRQWYQFDATPTDATVRVPRGEFFLDASAPADPADLTQGVDVVVQPRLTVDRDRTVTIDARTTRPGRVTVPDAGAKPAFGMLAYQLNLPGTDLMGGVHQAASFARLRVAHLGPEVTDGSLVQEWRGSWRKGAGTEYNATSGGPAKRISTGHTRHFTAAEFARVKVGIGSSVKGKQGTVEVHGRIPGITWQNVAPIVAQPLPAGRVVYMSTADGAEWAMDASQLGARDPGSGHQFRDIFLRSPMKRYQAGATHRENFNTGPFGPRSSQRAGIWRVGDTLAHAMPLFSDGQGHVGWSEAESAKTVLYRGTTRIAENDDPMTGRAPLPMGGREAGDFTLTTSVTRKAAQARAGSRTDASWSFHAPAAVSDDWAPLPISTVRFTGARVGLDSTAPAGAAHTLSLLVEGAAAKGNVKSLTAHASYDGGKTWKKLTVTKNKVTVKNPAKGKAITLRAEVTDKQGGTARVTSYNAWFGK
ncbi:S8 family serine peptidase [Streptomyces sp. CAU 1734]|uniref:S8 family peptidase n=1 Tax=Streptomyces sp. CAU 1734 TaxID=3140360 RepID=UPI003260CB49